MQQRTHQLDLAAVATGEFARGAVEVGAEAETFAALRDALARQRLRQALQIRLELQVAAHRQVEVQRLLLEHHADVAQGLRGVAAHRDTGDLDVTLVGSKQAGQHLEQRGLACAVGPEQCDELARRQRQRQRIERDPLAIALGQAVDPQQRCGLRDGCAHSSISMPSCIALPGHRWASSSRLASR